MTHPTAIDLLDSGHTPAGPFVVEVLHGKTWTHDTDTNDHSKALAIANALRQIQKQPGGSLGGGTEVRIVNGDGRSQILE